MTVSEWADAHRMLPAKASAEPGPWRTDRTPYLREIMDCLSASSPVEEVVLMKGAQVGGTEAIQNAVGYFIDQAPGPMMVVQPTVDLGKRYSRQRLDPMIADTPRLALKVADQSSRSAANTVLAKDFPGGTLIITGANSAVGLRSMPARYLLEDEVDGYPINVDDEGDPIDLAEARQRTFARRKRAKVSTPTVEGKSRIKPAFLAGDQRFYHVPCPHCGQMQKLIFSQLKWTQYGLDPRDAIYECISCEQAIENYHKTQMLAWGRWIAENPGADPKIRSYHLSSLYSPVGWFSWGDIAVMWEAAQGNQDKLRVFINTVLGETWKEAGEAPDWKLIYNRREHYAFGSVPAAVGFMTAGVDVGQMHLIYEIVGWGAGKQSWSIEAAVLAGDTALAAVWVQLDAVLNRVYEKATGEQLRIASMAVDSGYNTQHVYDWCRRRMMPQVIAVKGMPSGGALIGAPSKVDITHRGRRIKSGYKIWPVTGSIAKSELYGNLRLELPTVESGDAAPPGYCHFPEYGEDFFKQLTGEQLVTKRLKSGFVEFDWEKIPGRENHFLDARVYARAAAAVLGLDRMRDADWEKLGVSVVQKTVPDTPPPAPRPAASPRVPRERAPGGWLKRRR